jgi:opacity protein-like surface antigen
LYVGGQLGHGTTQSDNNGPRPDAATSDFTLDATRSGQGFTAGVMAGYGHQMNDFYIGGELELEASSADWNIERSPTGRIYSVDKQGTVGASVRVGYVLNDSVLIYGRVGYVQSRFNTNYQFNGIAVDQNDTLGGLRIGGGVEFALRDNLNARLEYTHTEYDRHSVNFGTGVDNFDTSERLFRVGLTYQF